MSLFPAAICKLCTHSLGLHSGLVGDLRWSDALLVTAELRECRAGARGKPESQSLARSAKASSRPWPPQLRSPLDLEEAPHAAGTLGRKRHVGSKTARTLALRRWSGRVVVQELSPWPWSVLAYIDMRITTHPAPAQVGFFRSPEAAGHLQVGCFCDSDGCPRCPILLQDLWPLDCLRRHNRAFTFARQIPEQSDLETALFSQKVRTASGLHGVISLVPGLSTIWRWANETDRNQSRGEEAHTPTLRSFVVKLSSLKGALALGGTGCPQGPCREDSKPGN